MEEMPGEKGGGVIEAFNCILGSFNHSISCYGAEYLTLDLALDSTELSYLLTRSAASEISFSLQKDTIQSTPTQERWKVPIN